MGRVELLRYSDQRFRVGSWRGHDDIAYVAPLTRADRQGIEHVLAEARRRGFATVVTGALGSTEQRPFLDHGFHVHERLHLLAHDLASLPAPPAAAPTRGTSVRLGRARRRDHEAALEVDGRAFDSFWRLDQPGLIDAVKATPVSRFRVARHPSAIGPGHRPVIGYAVAGRSRQVGYLQRLAVDPDHHGAGIGTLLVIDALRWMRRHRARKGLVNTQESNDRAVALYKRLGFVLQQPGLAVLRRAVEP